MLAAMESKNVIRSSVAMHLLSVARKEIPHRQNHECEIRRFYLSINQARQGDFSPLIDRLDYLLDYLLDYRG